MIETDRHKESLKILFFHQLKILALKILEFDVSEKVHVYTNFLDLCEKNNGNLVC